MSAGSAFGSAGPAGLQVLPQLALLWSCAVRSLQAFELSLACSTHLQGEATELLVPLLESDEIHSDTGAAAGQGDAAVHEGDVEQGLVAGSDAEAGSSKSEEDVAVAVSRNSPRTAAGHHVVARQQHILLLLLLLLLHRDALTAYTATHTSAQQLDILGFLSSS